MEYFDFLSKVYAIGVGVTAVGLLNLLGIGV